MHGGVQIYLKAFITLALDRSGSSVLRPCVSSPQGTHWIGSWMSYSTGLDVVEMTTDMLKILIFKTIVKHQNYTICTSVNITLKGCDINVFKYKVRL